MSLTLILLTFLTSLFTVISKATYHILLFVFIIFTVCIILDSDPFVLPKVITKNELRLVLVLISADIIQWLFVYLGWLYFSSYGDGSVENYWNQPVPTVVGEDTPITYDFSNLITTISGTILLANLLFVGFYLSWLAIY